MMLHAPHRPTLLLLGLNNAVLWMLLTPLNIIFELLCDPILIPKGPNCPLQAQLVQPQCLLAPPLVLEKDAVVPDTEGKGCRMISAQGLLIPIDRPPYGGAGGGGGSRA